MLHAGKGKFLGPWNFVTEFIAVEYADPAQTVKHAHVERLTRGNQCQSEAKAEQIAARRPQQTVAVQITPSDEYCSLQEFETVEEEF